MKVLVVDDDPQIREVLTIALDRAGFQCLSVGDGRAALREAGRWQPDLVVLDVGLPHLDGLDVCRRLRSQGPVPILFLSARSDEVDRIVGLELGADDYVAKPFSPRELVARVRAVLKRHGAGSGGPPILGHGDLRLDMAARACVLGERPVALTASEIALLDRLLRRPSHVVTRAQLRDAVHGPGTDVSDRTVDSHLRNLRRKLAEAGCPDAIETLHGQGVRMGRCEAT